MRRGSGAVAWGVASAVCFLLVLPVAVWTDVFGGDVSSSVVAPMAGLAAVGALCFTVATALRSRDEHASFLRTLGRTLAAPIRFLLNLP